ncbi:MAG: hypothetical protein IJT44_05815 [Clostridia bacterium]|nr:hypothetical protein [Clostridia bacterium]
MKRILNVLLAAILMLSVIPFPAFAAKEARPAVRFITKEDRLLAVDFSGMIRDRATITEKTMTVTFSGVGESGWCCLAEFDDEGFVCFGYPTVDAAFAPDAIYLGALDYSYTLYAEGGKLFDDVASYTFSVRDIFDRMKNDLEIMHLPYPTVTVSKADGGLVKELTLDFGADFLPDSVDTEKAITLTARYDEVKCTFTAKPVRFADGVLTVRLFDANGQEGVALHNLKVIAADGAPDYQYIWTFTFDFPCGMFRYGNANGSLISNVDETLYYFADEIENIPIRTTTLNEKVNANKRRKNGGFGCN